MSDPITIHTEPVDPAPAKQPDTKPKPTTAAPTKADKWKPYKLGQ